MIALTAVLCITVAAGAAGAINMWYDRDIDAVMRRTASRPIPAGRIGPDEALAFGVTLAVGSVLVMYLATNLAAAAILALSIAFYVFVYTIWLKRRTPQNIVIGGGCRRVSAGDRLGGRHRQRRHHAAPDVRDDFLLDAAAFLVALAVGQ